MDDSNRSVNKYDAKISFMAKALDNQWNLCMYLEYNPTYSNTSWRHMLQITLHS